MFVKWVFTDPRTQPNNKIDTEHTLHIKKPTGNYLDVSSMSLTQWGRNIHWDKKKYEDKILINEKTDWKLWWTLCFSTQSLQMIVTIIANIANYVALKWNVAGSLYVFMSVHYLCAEIYLCSSWTSPHLLVPMCDMFVRSYLWDHSTLKFTCE